jgi:iron complex transport system permease protein
MRLPPYVTCLAALAAALVLSVALGPESIPPGEVARIIGSWITGNAGQGIAEQIVLAVRLPDAVKYALVGAALAGSGAAYQGLLRNPLADPYLIGVAPGAALGATLAFTYAGPHTALGIFTVPMAAFLGAMATVAAVYRLARVGKSAPVTTLILAGVAVGAFANAAAYAIMLSGQTELRRVVYFMLGGFVIDGWLPVAAALPYMAIGLGVVILHSNALNVLQFGDEQAAQLGLRVERSKLILVAAASLAAAASVAFLGIVGFVGLVVPHIIRLLWGPDYRRLVPLSVIGGAAFLSLTHTAGRTAEGLRGLPLGVLTAFAGAPVFLYLLHRVRRSYW